jgi:cation diffusion facilitator CzcD-associated flavoprotein CzcO
MVKQPPPDVDVLVIGAGIIGIYQLHTLREAGLNVQALEAGSGPGGVWYWNRYPSARFDTESYVYAYIFSKELFNDWRWSEHFAAQPEIERYLNHVVDRFDLRRHIRFGARVTSAVYDEAAGIWTVKAGDGTEVRAHIVVSVTGGLSAPIFPNVPGRESFKGIAYHTAEWPKEPLDFKGKRVAVVGVGSSGVQVAPAVADEVASLTVYQRTANWVTPLNNRPISDEEQADMRENFEEMRYQLRTTPGGFHRPPSQLAGASVARHEWPAYFEKMWNSMGFAKLAGTFIDVISNPEVNGAWCAFVADKIRSIVKDPATADKLTPKDHPYNGKRPPFAMGYYETFNRPHVELVDLKEHPLVRVTTTGIQTTDGIREFDIIVWATGFDFGYGSLKRMGVVGRGGLSMNEYWKDGATDFFGVMTHNFPNFFHPGGPHGAGAGNYPRQASDQVDFITDTIVYMRDHDQWIVEVPKEREEEFMALVAETAARTGYSINHSHYWGANVDGKPRTFLLNSVGRPKMLETFNGLRQCGWAGFFSPVPVSSTAG